MNFQKDRNKLDRILLEESKKEEPATKNRLEKLFEQSWEVFVVKWDNKTESYVGRIACCALEPV